MSYGKKKQKARPVSRFLKVHRAAKQARAEGRTLRRGSRGLPVRFVQERLGVRATGHFGPPTAKQVRRFKARRGWAPYAVVGKRMLRALGA